MNPRFLRYYSQELQHLREVGGEFAQDYPKIAGRLGLEGFECADPYVERLLEGFSFLAARVQLKIDAEFPRFTQHLCALVYPHLLAPTPSMAVVQLQPDLGNPALKQGVAVPRGSAMRSVLGKGDITACEYRSAHALTLWPIELVEAKFFTHSGGNAGLRVPLPTTVKAGIRLRLRSHGVPFSELPIERLSLHLRGPDALPVQLYETMLAHVEGVLVTPVTRPAAWHSLLPGKALQAEGFGDDEALLPGDPRTFHGYRLLQEYFAFPQRYQFVGLDGLRAGLSQCADKEVEVTILLNQGDAQLEKMVDAAYFALHCTPVVNLFQRRADRIHVSGDQFEYHVLVDRTRPMDYEVHQVASVTGYGSGADAEQAFMPFYTARDTAHGVPQDQAFFQLRREQRVISQRQRRDGRRSSYIGSEAFIAIVDAAEAPYRGDLRQLGLSVWCTNRDLPLAMPLGTGKTDFIFDSGAPVEAVRCVAGPSQPRASFAEGSMAWRLVNHLSLNYLSLVDTDPGQGAVALRELLALYCPDDPHARRQVEGVRTVTTRPVTRRMPSPGPITVGRGLEIALGLDDAAFAGASAFVLGGVLSEFFGHYVSINAFTETVVTTPARGQIMRWPVKGGACAIL